MPIAYMNEEEFERAILKMPKAFKNNLRTFFEKGGKLLSPELNAKYYHDNKRDEW